MSWTERPIANLEQFLDALTDVLPTTTDRDTEYWFRGQSNSSWPLASSFLRSSEHLQIGREAGLRLESEALKAFQWQAHIFTRYDLLQKVRTRPCWWALMQHHRAPTRLLDWTTSPYVAAYFAAQPDDASAGAVWCFCSRKLRRAFEEHYGAVPAFEAAEAPDWYVNKLEELSETRVVLPLTFSFASSERMVAQQGRFTMGFKLGEQHDCIAECVGDTYVRKLVIPPESKRELLLRLREMNITASALFPGVDGLGQSIRELVSLGGVRTASVPGAHDRTRGAESSLEPPSQLALEPSSPVGS